MKAAAKNTSYTGNDLTEATTPNEKICISDYLAAVEYYMLTLVKLMG